MEGARLRDAVVELDGINLACSLLSTPNLPDPRIVAWALANMFRARPNLSADFCKSAMPCLARFNKIDENSSKDEVRTAEALLWGLAYATDGNNTHIQIAIDANVVNPLANILRQDHANFELKKIFTM